MAGFNSAPTLADLAKYAVNRPGQAEVVRQSLYDFLLYPEAGINQLVFFSTPAGQGVSSAPGAVVGSQKTQADTNMTNAGLLPAPQQFLIQSIELKFYPGSSVAANTFVPAKMDQFNAVAAASLNKSADDVMAFSSSGWLQLFIGSKAYLQEAPLGRFPPKTNLSLQSAVANNSATTSEVEVMNAVLSGRPYMLDPPLALVNNQNFQVSLNWPGAVALPSGFNGRIGVVLDGWLYRNSQ